MTNWKQECRCQLNDNFRIGEASNDLELHPRRIRVKFISNWGSELIWDSNIVNIIVSVYRTSSRVFLLEELVNASSFLIVSDFNLIYVLDELGDHFAWKFDHSTFGRL